MTRQRLHEYTIKSACSKDNIGLTALYSYNRASEGGRGRRRKANNPFSISREEATNPDCDAGWRTKDPSTRPSDKRGVYKRGEKIEFKRDNLLVRVGVGSLLLAGAGHNVDESTVV